jgi:hypothetical protein
MVIFPRLLGRLDNILGVLGGNCLNRRIYHHWEVPRQCFGYGDGLVFLGGLSGNWFKVLGRHISFGRLIQSLGEIYPIGEISLKSWGGMDFLGYKVALRFLNGDKS